MKTLYLALSLAFFSAATISQFAIAQDDKSAEKERVHSADAFATCSACHLADGAGIPGAFPPLRNRLAAIASLDGGRDYLITVVSFGLMGTIEVGGMQYFGVMAGNKGAMTAEEISSALNYAVFELADHEVEAVPVFTADEVNSAQSTVSAASPAVAGELRKKLLEQHGDQWPK